MEQGTEEWFEARLGKITASRVSDVMAKTRSGYGAARKNYMMELLCQRLTGNREESFVNAAMMRGTELEPVARSAYEIAADVMVEEAGFVDHPSIKGFGCSPDGLVGKDGLVEIKCPNTAQHVEFLRTGKIDRKYQLQMTAQMACTNRNWCDFVSFDDRMPEDLQYKCMRFEFPGDLHKEMIQEVSSFLKELETIIQELRPNEQAG